jgi:hypothetical protein
VTYVTVYKFKVWDDVKGRYVVSRRMGTLGAVGSARGVIVEGTATEVPPSELDAEGLTVKEYDEGSQA